MVNRLTCSICGVEKSNYVLQLKRVCLRCDELLFDMEIELDEENPMKATVPGEVSTQNRLDLKKE